MKTFIKASLTGLLVTLLVSTGVLAAYAAAITVTESSSNSYDMLPVSATMANSDLASGYYITGTGLDTRVLSVATPLPHMLASDRTLFALPISADTQYQLAYSTGNAALDNFYVITGYNGYITVSKAAALELGNNFEIEQKGYIDTSSGADKNLVYKSEAVGVWVSASTNITAGIYSTASPTGHIDSGDTWSNETNVYDESTGTYAGEVVVEGTWGNYLELTHAAMLTESIRYWVQDAFIAAGQINLDAYYGGQWNDVYEGTYTEGAWETKALGSAQSVTSVRAKFYNPDGSDKWMYFHELDYLGYGASVTATGVSSGVHTVKTVATGGGTDKLQIWVGDGDAAPTLRDEVDLSGASVPDNSNNWTLMQTNVMPYMEYYKHTTAGTPAVQERSKGATSTSDVTSHAITLPSSIVVGELLLVVFSVDGNPTCTDESGLWTKLSQASYGTDVTGAIFYKTAIGDDSLTITTSAAQQSSHIALRISNYSGVPTATSATDYSTNSDPPNHNPAVSKFYLWVATRSGDSTVVATVAPNNYNNLQTQAATGTSGASTNTAERSLLAPSEDPGTFTSTAEQWVSYTISVPPVSSSSLRVWYQPVTMISGTILPDRATEDAVQNGAITWGSNPGGVAATVGALLPETSSTADVTADAESPSFAPETSDESWFVPGVEGEGFPFYGLFKGLLDSYKDLGGADISMPYFWKIVAGLAGLMFGTFFLLATRSLLIGAVAYIIGFVVPATMGVLDWWMVIIYIMGAIPLCILSTKWHAV